MRQRPPGRAWLIPVRFAECAIPAFPLGAGRALDSLQFIDLFDGAWEHAVPRLLRAVLSILPGPAHAASRGETGPRERTSRQDWDARLLHAERIAHAIPDAPLRAQALARIAAATAGSDRAAHLAGQAGKAAMESRLPTRQANTLALAAAVIGASSYDLAAQLADQAEDIAVTIAGWHDKTMTLAQIAEQVYSFDPGRAARLADQAAQAAATTPDSYSYSYQLEAAYEVAVAMVNHDFRRALLVADEAERIAEQAAARSPFVHFTTKKAHQLNRMAVAAASYDADIAQEITSTITDGKERSIALLRVVAAVAVRDTARAERIARAMNTERETELALKIVVRTGAAERDPGFAERIARTLSPGNPYWDVLAMVAVAVADSNPGHAVELADEIEQASASQDHWARAVLLAKAASVVADRDQGRAARLADQAEHAARADHVTESSNGPIENSRHSPACLNISDTNPSKDPSHTLEAPHATTPHAINEVAGRLQSPFLRYRLTGLSMFPLVAALRLCMAPGAGPVLSRWCLGMVSGG